MGWEIIFLILAIAFAGKAGAKALASAYTSRRRAKKERKAHKSQLVTEAIERGVAPKSAKAAADKAARAAVTVSTWAAVRIAAKDGWRKGWKKGRDRGLELRDGTKPFELGDESTKDHAPTVESPPNDREPNAGEGTLTEPSQAAHCSVHRAISGAEYGELVDTKRCTRRIGSKRCPVGHEIPEFCKQPVTADDTLLCDHHRAAPADAADAKPTPVDQPAENNTKQAQPAKENNAMTIETTTGGEILTKEQLFKEMESIVQEETAEIEDAEGDLKRAQEHVQRIEVIAASLANMQIDAETVAKVRVFIDASSSRVPEAKGRIASAEARRAAASAVPNTLNQSAQNQFYSA